MIQNNKKNQYMLIQEQKSIKDDNMSIASTLVSSKHHSSINEKSYAVSHCSTKLNSMIYDRSTINSLCRRISNSIKRNYDGIQTRRETRREKRPQDGKTNPME